MMSSPPNVISSEDHIIYVVFFKRQMLWKWSRLKETKKTQQLNAIPDPKLDPVLKEEKIRQRMFLGQSL